MEAMICKNWGCDTEFESDVNEKNSCTYHPGKYQFGSLNGLWPESWTCCRGDWFATGCRRGFHRGTPKAAPIRHCINHGEPNPKSIYPDSFCGAQFTEVDIP